MKNLISLVVLLLVSVKPATAQAFGECPTNAPDVPQTPLLNVTQPVLRSPSF